MTTKAQELKTLEQIRKLVEGLGDNSYVGMAFEGCFEVAKENIQNDWGCSLKQRAESAEKKIGSYEELAKNHRQLKADFETIRIQKFEAENRAGVAESKIVDLEAEIVRLKARLFDLMDQKS